MERSFFPHFPRGLRLALLAAAGALLAVVPFLVNLLGLKTDFLSFYTGGYLALRGATTQFYDFELHRQWQLEWVGPVSGIFRYVYLPAFTALYLPLAALPLLAARLLWAGLGLLLLGVAVRLSRTWGGLTAAEGWLALLAFPASYGTFLVGQNTPLTLALFASVAALLWHGKGEALAGVLAGLALYKPQLLVPLVGLWLWQRRVAPLAALAGMAGGVLAASFLVSPASTWRYLTLGPWLLQSTTTHRANASLFAEASRHVASPLAPWVAGGLAALVLALLLAAWRRNERAPRHAHAMLWLAPLLVTPYVAQYDLLLLALPLSLLAPALRHDRPMLALVALLWVGVLVNLVAGHLTLLASWATLALYLLCCWRVRQQRATPQPEPRPASAA